MSYRFRDSGKVDIRIRRSTRSIKGVYLDMLGEMDEDDITVSSLTDRAGVNRKTFYLHYKNKTALRDEIADDMIRTLDDDFTGDMESDILALYEFLDTDDEGCRKLFGAPEYRDFRDRLYGGIFRHGAFGEIAETSKYPSLTVGYLYSVVGIYDRYMEQNPVRKNLKKLAKSATHLALRGLSGGVSHKCVSLFQISKWQRILRSGLSVCAMAS